MMYSIQRRRDHSINFNNQTTAKVFRHAVGYSTVHCSFMLHNSLSRVFKVLRVMPSICAALLLLLLQAMSTDSNK